MLSRPSPLPTRRSPYAPSRILPFTLGSIVARKTTNLSDAVLAPSQPYRAHMLSSVSSSGGEYWRAGLATTAGRGVAKASVRQVGRQVGASSSAARRTSTAMSSRWRPTLVLHLQLGDAGVAVLQRCGQAGHLCCQLVELLETLHDDI